MPPPECGQQAAGKDSAGLKRVNAEDFAGMRRVVAPLIDDVEDLCPDNSAQYDENPEVPGLVAVDPSVSELRTLIQSPIRTPMETRNPYVGRKKLPEMKELWEHYLVRCGNTGICYWTSLAGNDRRLRARMALMAGDPRGQGRPRHIRKQKSSRPTRPCDGPRMNRR